MSLLALQSPEWRQHCVESYARIAHADYKARINGVREHTSLTLSYQLRKLCCADMDYLLFMM